MHCSNSGLLRERVGHLGLLLVALLVTHNLKVATGTSVSLTVKQPLDVFGDVVIVDSAKNPLIAIVNCTGTQLQANVNKEASTMYGNGSLEVQLERGNKPNEYFLLPNMYSFGKTLPEGEYQVDVICSNHSTPETNDIRVSVISSAIAADSKVPYFIDLQRTVTIPASTPPGTVVTSFKAEVCATALTYARTHARGCSDSLISITAKLTRLCCNAYLHDLHSPVPRGATIWNKGICCPRSFLRCTFHNE